MALNIIFFSLYAGSPDANTSEYTTSKTQMEILICMTSSSAQTLAKPSYTGTVIGIVRSFAKIAQ